MLFQKVTATKKIFNLKKRVRGVSGGTSASKTISILLWLIKYCQTYNNSLVSVVSETLPHLKRGAIRDFLNIMTEHGYFEDARWNKTDFTYTFSTGTKLEFFSADQPGKVRGPRRDILFINEANNISYETYTQLEIRTNKVIWIDYNPVSEFWWYTEVLPHHDVDFITLTYKDNESLNPAIVKAIEDRKHNVNWYRVYGEGQLGEAEGRIYTGWVLIDSIPHEARIERRGLDFGYSNDPTALIDIYYYNGGYILDEQIFRKGLSNKDIADYIINLPKNDTLVVADSAEPKSIDEIKSYGVNIMPVKKGKDSIRQGIQYVQDQQISVTKKSTNIIKEYRNYLWEVDSEGKTLNTPISIWNHTMDAIRYAFDSLKPIEDIESLIHEIPKEEWREGGFY
jgi:phage terminase large subunit